VAVPVLALQVLPMPEMVELAVRAVVVVTEALEAQELLDKVMLVEPLQMEEVEVPEAVVVLELLVQMEALALQMQVPEGLA
tara:strand:+ start:275 stop:517 length:243 start_codon:yes stop_codon:yes gene_type:complete